MSNKKLAGILNIIIIILAALGLLFLIGMIPNLNLSEDLINLDIKVKVFLIITGILYFIALYQGFKLSNNIKDNKGFIRENIKYLNIINYMSIGELLLYGGASVYIIYRIGFDKRLIFTLLFAFFGFIFAIISGIFSNLVNKAVEIEEENQLTI